LPAEVVGRAFEVAAMTNRKLLGNDYPIYRVVLIINAFCLVLGLLFSMGMLATAVMKPPPGRAPPETWVTVLMAVMGVGGLIGGIGVLCGSRRWSLLIHGITIPLLLVFPIGTLISGVMIARLGRYFDCCDRIRRHRLGLLDEFEEIDEADQPLRGRPVEFDDSNPYSSR
jgi:hypothetical protein